MSAGLGDIKFTNASMIVCREWGFAKRKDLSVRKLICKISMYLHICTSLLLLRLSLLLFIT